MRFMEILPRGERLALVREARARLEDHIKAISSIANEDKRQGDTFRYLSHRNAVLGMRAQVAWLKEVETLL